MTEKLHAELEQLRNQMNELITNLIEHARHNNHNQVNYHSLKIRQCRKRKEQIEHSLGLPISEIPMLKAICDDPLPKEPTPDA